MSADDDRDEQIAALIGLVEALTEDLKRVEDTVDELTEKPAVTEPEQNPAEPGSWVWVTPPIAAEDDPDSPEDPRFTIQNFVAWYNVTFIGLDSSRARPIPACWEQHSGLAMEVAALAYSWRAANIGPRANPRDAQHWLHQWRPGFSDRLTREWVHPDCHHGEHRSPHPTRANRFELAEQAEQHAAHGHAERPPPPDLDSDHAPTEPAS